MCPRLPYGISPPSIDEIKRRAGGVVERSFKRSVRAGGDGDKRFSSAKMSRTGNLKKREKKNK